MLTYLCSNNPIIMIFFLKLDDTRIFWAQVFIIFVQAFIITHDEPPFQEDRFILHSPGGRRGTGNYNYCEAPLSCNLSRSASPIPSKSFSEFPLQPFLGVAIQSLQMGGFSSPTQVLLSLECTFILSSYGQAEGKKTIDLLMNNNHNPYRQTELQKMNYVTQWDLV